MGLQWHRRLLAVIAILCVASVGEAQQAASTTREVFVGMRVRVLAPTLRSDTYVGRVDSLDQNAMVLDTARARSRLGFDTGPVLVEQYRRTRIPLSAIDRLEVSGGRTTRGSTIRGALIGALVGGLLWGLGNLPEVNPKAADFFKEAPVGAAVGVVIGGGIGFALGGEKWLPAQIPR